jgi:hypothetical protein
VGSLRGRRRRRRRVQIGAPDPSLTPVAGMVAVTELVERLDVICRLDAAIGPIKARRRGHSAAGLLVGIAARSWPGKTSWSGWTGQWHAVETGIGDVPTAAVAMLPADRAAALCEQVTIDLDTTDVEVYGRANAGWRSTTKVNGSVARTWPAGPTPRRCWPRTC